MVFTHSNLICVTIKYSEKSNDRSTSEAKANGGRYSDKDVIFKNPVITELPKLKYVAYDLHFLIKI